MRPIRAVLLTVISAVAASAIAYVAFLRPRIKAWGFDATESELALSGDELVAEPIAKETRGITIDASPAEIWPWLVQMGYGRGGWYSYEPLDSKMPSAHEIKPEFQELKVGDQMPTYPGFSFEVKVVEPEQALVLFTDSAQARAQMAENHPEAADKQRDFPDFSASWGFYLEPKGEGKTRLIERFRVDAPQNAPKAVMNEAFGTGVALMARKQLIGIKERVERLGVQQEADADVQPTPEPGFAPDPGFSPAN